MGSASPISLSIPTSVLDDCKQRDARCCRALLIPSLEAILEDMLAKKDEHLLAPVSCGVCAVCKTSASDGKSEDDVPAAPPPVKSEPQPPAPLVNPAKHMEAQLAAMQAGFAFPAAAIAMQAAAANAARGQGDPSRGMFMPMMMPMMQAPGAQAQWMLPPGMSAMPPGMMNADGASVPMLIYCGMPYGMPTMLPMGMVPPRPPDSVASPAAREPAAAKVSASSPPTNSPSPPTEREDCATKKRAPCNHMRSKFNSTGNLKRRVHTLLFWKSKLGAHFPVIDSMLRDSVWKNLNSCEYGIKTSNGHPKFRCTGACINPHHYVPRCYRTILSVLDDSLRTMRALDAAPALAEMFKEANQASPEAIKSAFETICETLRTAVISPQHSC